MLDARHQIGGNFPPSDLELLQEKLRTQNADALDYAAKLVERADKIPDELDEETAQKVTDYIALCNKHTKHMEGLRESEKRPFLTLGRAVDAFFGDVNDKIAKAKASANAKLTAHLRKKAAAEQKARDDAAAALRAKQAEEEAKAKAAAEANKPREAVVAQAAAANTAQQAERMEKAAEAKPAQMARSRGSTGATASLRTVWVGTLTDRMVLDLEALRQHLPEAGLQQAINSYVKAGGRTLKGADIKEVHEAVTR